MAERRRGADRRRREVFDPHALINDFQYVILNDRRASLVGLAAFIKLQREMIEFRIRLESEPAYGPPET